MYCCDKYKPGNLTDERWEEIRGVNEAVCNAHAHLWGVLRNKDTYAPTVREKWKKKRLEDYYKNYIRSLRHFDETLEIFLTKEDKKAINDIVRRRLESLITGQIEM
jgi:hypothetical protein